MSEGAVVPTGERVDEPAVQPVAGPGSEAVAVTIEEVHTFEECREVVALLDQIWSVEDASILDLHLLIAMAHSGNYVVLARAGDEPVGAAMGFFGPPGTPFHSHIVGVAGSATGRGIGRAIKAHQRDWCLARGTDRMVWTYDPLVARNAHFNIRVLGGLPVEYLPDFYGEMPDSVNIGQGSDRIVLGWDLGGASAATANAVAEVPAGTPHVVLGNTAEAPGEPDLAVPAGVDWARIGIPWDIEALRRTDPELGRLWRERTRAAFLPLLADGWRVQDFDDDGYYLLRRP